MQQCLQALLRRINSSQQYQTEEACLDQDTLRSMESSLQALLFKSELTTSFS